MNNETKTFTQLGTLDNIIYNFYLEHENHNKNYLSVIDVQELAGHPEDTEKDMKKSLDKLVEDKFLEKQDNLYCLSEESFKYVEPYKKHF